MKSVKSFWPVLKYYRRTVEICHKSNFIPLSGALRHFSSENAHAEELVAQEKIQLSKPAIKKWKREPFFKNFFFGKFDIELLAFPEILNKEQLAELENTVKSLNDIMHQKVDPVQIGRTGHIPDDVLEELKELGLFGRMIPSKYGGLDLTYTACTRINEVLGLDWSIFSSLAIHEFLATQAILKFGSEDQKSFYLPKLASGDLIAAFCFHEKESGSDILSMSTTVDQLPDGTLLLNGTKSWVSNASRAGVFIVFGKTKENVDASQNEVSAFIVDSNQEGIEIVKQNTTTLRGLDSGIVHFKNVVLQPTSVIQSMGLGFPIYLKCLESLRIVQNSFTFGTLKALLDKITERITDTERRGESLADKQLIRRRLSKINSTIYGMETLSYFTAALLDSTENPDIELEAAALKLFNSRGTLFCLQEMMELVGASSFTEDMQLERFYRDAQGLNLLDAPNDIAKLFISFVGLKMVGIKKFEDVEKMRNTMFFPKHTMKELFRRWKVSKGFYKYDQDIAGHLHPSLVGAANRLEEKIQVFELCVENILEDHGAKVLFTQIDPMILAETAIDLYAIAAVLARCSRSYCIGLKNCHHELTLTSAFCHDADTRLEFNMQKILTGMTNNNEGYHLQLGTQVVDCRGYFAEHPLKHNF